MFTFHCSHDKRSYTHHRPKLSPDNFLQLTQFNTVQKPTNKLEEEIYEALEADAHVIERPDHFLTEAEEKSLEELNAEEVVLKICAFHI